MDFIHHFTIYFQRAHLVHLVIPHLAVCYIELPPCSIPATAEKRFTFFFRWGEVNWGLVGGMLVVIKLIRVCSVRM